MQIISPLTRRNTEIFPSALYMISLNQSLNLPPYCDEFLSVHVIASDDEGITPLTDDWKVKAE